MAINIAQLEIYTMQKYTEPFEHYVIDDFLDHDLALKLSEQFLPFDSPKWYVYDSPLEVKKTINEWYSFPPETYQFFHYMCSTDFISTLEQITKTSNLIPDIGLHGGGWHIHGNKGKLNVHLDYSLHPKLNLLRKYNIILYLSPEWKPEWGGNLEFWSHDEEKNLPKEKVSTIECKFNRAVIFDASQNSWHGFNDPIDCEEGHYRKSIAMYYHTVAEITGNNRHRALYSPSEEQKNNEDILKLIESRSK